MKFSEQSFTPSEFVLLNGHRFAPEEPGDDGYQLLFSDKKVNGPILAVMVINAAVLASEAEGGLRLDEQVKKPLFGVETRRLLVFPLYPTINWSGLTLEDSLLNLATAALANKTDRTLGNVLIELVKSRRSFPWKRVLEVVEWGLASNNYLIPVDGKAAEAFTTPFILPQKVRELVINHPEEPLVELLNGCKKNRPGIWSLLRSEAEIAFGFQRN